MSIWSDKLALTSPEERRKLCALGLAYLCGTGWPPVLKVWPHAVTAVAEVVFDVTMEDSTQDKLVSWMGLRIFIVVFIAFLSFLSIYCYLVFYFFLFSYFCF